MKRRAIEFDFARSRPRLSLRGIVLLGAGLTAAAFVLSDYHDVAEQSAGLEWRLAKLRGDARPASPDKGALRIEQDAAAALHDLTTPWSVLLRELELASADSKGTVAVLGVEPDRDKGEVRIAAEARTLPIALAYVERLQQSQALRYPMLERHEVQMKDPERPVRFQIKADWRVAP